MSRNVTQFVYDPSKVGKVIFGRFALILFGVWKDVSLDAVNDGSSVSFILATKLKYDGSKASYSVVSIVSETSSISD